PSSGSGFSCNSCEPCSKMTRHRYEPCPSSEVATMSKTPAASSWHSRTDRPVRILAIAELLPAHTGHAWLLGQEAAQSDAEREGVTARIDPGLGTRVATGQAPTRPWPQQVRGRARLVETV